MKAVDPGSGSALDLSAPQGYSCVMDVAARRQLLAMAQRRAGPGSGSLIDRVMERNTPYDAGALLPDLGTVPFAVVGGLATSCYMPPRMTLDTDILISPEHSIAVEARLVQVGCKKLGELSIGGSSWRMVGGRVLDVIALDHEWVHEAIDSVPRGQGEAPFIALPFLVLMKLESGRLQDLADISRMMGCAGDDAIQATRQTVGHYRQEDAEDLESMIRLGKLEHRAT